MYTLVYKSDILLDMQKGLIVLIEVSRDLDFSDIVIGPFDDELIEQRGIYAISEDRDSISEFEVEVDKRFKDEGLQLRKLFEELEEDLAYETEEEDEAEDLLGDETEDISCLICKHFGKDVDEKGVAACRAFPKEIPADILTGNWLHNRSFPGQESEILFDLDTAEI